MCTSSIPAYLAQQHQTLLSGRQREAFPVSWLCLSTIREAPAQASSLAPSSGLVGKSGAMLLATTKGHPLNSLLQDLETCLVAHLPQSHRMALPTQLSQQPHHHCRAGRGWACPACKDSSRSHCTDHKGLDKTNCWTKQTEIDHCQQTDRPVAPHIAHQQLGFHSKREQDIGEESILILWKKQYFFIKSLLSIQEV